MPSAPLPPEKRAEIDDLANAIREAIDAEIGELAEGLAATDGARLFGANEFKIRALAHRIAARAILRPSQAQGTFSGPARPARPRGHSARPRGHSGFCPRNA